MQVELFQIDAFTNQVFGGNPAAVMPLPEWLNDKTLQAIASENNLSETAFIVPFDKGFQIRWFTPVKEIELCGHATLASGYVVTQFLNPGSKEVDFYSAKHGVLSVIKDGSALSMDFPTRSVEQIEVSSDFVQALGARPKELYRGLDFMAVFNSEDEVAALSPNFAKLEAIVPHGISVTAVGKGSDFVSRSFFPAFGIPEDPVTGATHTMLTPYWAKRLNKSQLHARQLSRRGGALKLSLVDDRVIISGEARLYLRGTANIPDGF